MSANAADFQIGPLSKWAAFFLAPGFFRSASPAAAVVFGLMSYIAERGTHDFGVRLALGAPAHHVLWLVLKKGLMLAVFGLGWDSVRQYGFPVFWSVCFLA